MRINQKYIFKRSKAKTVVFIVLIGFFITIGVGYSYLKQQLDIYATASIVANNIDNFKKGNSKYSWQIEDYIDENEGRIYNINLNIANYDDDLKTCVIGFEVPNSFQLEKSKINNENATISYNGKRVTIMLNEFSLKGENIYLNLNFKFKDIQDIYIDKLTLNGLLAINE